jgi:hypothetical protein
MTITAAPFAAPDGKGAVVAVTIGLRYPAPLDATEAGSLERFDVLASAFTPDGRPRGAHRFDLDFPHRQRDPDVTYERLVTLPLDVGRYHLRVALRNQARNQSGSVYTDVDIPDFSRQPLSLSGLLIERSVSASDRSESQFIPASATTQRAFEPHEPVAAFVRVYERRSDSASSVRVSVRIIDAAENVVYESSETVHPEGTGPLAWADLRVPLPLGRLQSGPHLLAMEASTGREKASRHVRFTLK